MVWENTDSEQKDIDYLFVNISNKPHVGDWPICQGQTLCLVYDTFSF